MHENLISQLSVKEIFASDKYVIPSYQRNYAWGEEEIHQLILDIWDYAGDPEKRDQNYYIGTLVVFERKLNDGGVFETIDGQQRLTTLNILVSALYRLFPGPHLERMNLDLNLNFDSRIKSTNTLIKIADVKNDLIYSDHAMYNPDIQQGYSDAEKLLKQILKTEKDSKNFFSFLFSKVIIMRVKVPADTDLNHYFEIMNSRGEQLEKHEILKSYMLNIIHEEPGLIKAFTAIWEACSDMERYVQYGFQVNIRDQIFTKNSWNDLDVDSLEDVAKVFGEIDEEQERDPNKPKRGKKARSPEDNMTIVQIVDFEEDFEVNKTHDADAPERFSSVVNFPNFLLHVLRIQEGDDIPLDDKRLIETFEGYLGKGRKATKQRNAIDFVKNFGFNMLHCKFLMDKYIIKREYLAGKDQWSLKQLSRRDSKKSQVSYISTFNNDGWNEWFVKILSMFHVSAPTKIYKHWLNAALKYVFENSQSGQIDPEKYFEYLYGLAEAFLLDRFLVPSDSQLDYYQMIYQNKGKAQNKSNSRALDLDLLNHGTGVENFVFNYLDFKLWANEYNGYKNFDFGFRSSVEHYYPQHPIAENEKIDQKICDNFGNLCLISNRKNSRLSNHMPNAKMDFYYKTGPDSLKQQAMMDVTKKQKDWNESLIQEEGKKMRDILLSQVEW
ncbi:MAG: DUF262 domain-containing HNH endonuclease family protein [Spirochaetia bacterium]|nr:DUF262 domain-containing HNH endonuclease family protein [Spirochaetia bacterium]